MDSQAHLADLDKGDRLDLLDSRDHLALVVYPEVQANAEALDLQVRSSNKTDLPFRKIKTFLLMLRVVV